MSYVSCPSCKHTWMGGHSEGCPRTERCPKCKVIHRRFKALLVIEVDRLAKDLKHAEKIFDKELKESRWVKKVVKVSEDPEALEAYIERVSYDESTLSAAGGTIEVE